MKGGGEAGQKAEEAGEGMKKNNDPEPKAETCKKKRKEKSKKALERC